MLDYGSVIIVNAGRQPVTPWPYVTLVKMLPWLPILSITWEQEKKLEVSHQEHS